MLPRKKLDSSTSDEDLIELTAAGQREAFERLLERHAAAVLRLARVLTGDPAAAEDVLQQSFLSVYRNASQFRGKSSVKTWIFVITRNASYRFKAKHAREDLVEEPLMQLGAEAGWGSSDPETLAIASERRGALMKAMSNLSTEDQQVLVLRDIEGLRGPEAAQVLEISERALKSRLHRARLRLAGVLRSAELVTPDTEGGSP